MRTLVLAEHHANALNEVTARAVTAAARLGNEIHVLVAGQGVAPAAVEAARLDGVSTVLLADDASLAHGLAEPLSALLVALSEHYDAVVAAATAEGKNVLPRVAALLDVMQVSDVIEIVSADTFRRPAYAGNVIQTVRSRDATKVMTIRASSFAPAGQAASPASIETVVVPATAGRAVFVEQSLSGSERPELTGAKIVVSGGRALGSKEKFLALLEPVADRLGAALGASRAAVDAGYAPNDWQVGQTGKIVAPDLYIAVGISGAIQHLAGMKDSRVIVAINTDPEAPIFKLADYGLVGDLFEILPELDRELAARAK